jgi:type IV pilus secretin PilQ/predicted competence protein
MRMAFRATATATALALSWAAAVGCSSGGAKTHAADTATTASANSEKAPAGSTSPAASVKITQAAVNEDSDGARLVLTSNAPLLYTSYEPRPDLLIVDLRDASVASGFQTPATSGGLVESIKFEELDELGRRITRLSIAHQPDSKPVVRSVGQGLAIAFSGPATASAEEAPAPAAAPAEVPAVAAVTSTPLAPAPAPALVEAPKAAPASLAARGESAHALETVDTQVHDGRVAITLVGDGWFAPKDFVLANPPRLVIDLPGVKNEVRQRAIAVKGDVVSRVRVSQFQTSPEMVTRVVIDLARPVAYAIAPDGERLAVLVGEGVSAAEIAPSAPAATAETPVAASVPEAPAPASVPEAPVAASTTTIAEAPQSQEHAQPEPAAAAPTPLEEALAPATVQAESAPEQKPEPAPVAVAKSTPAPVPRIETVAVAPTSAPHPQTAPVAASVPPPPVETAVTHVAPPPAAPEPAPAPAPAARPAKSSPKSSRCEALFEAAAAALDQEQSAPANNQYRSRTISEAQSQFTGEPISLDLKDADIKDVFRTISQLTGLNIVIDPEVRGTVTVQLEDVPWDQALDLILKQNSLGYVLENNIMRIATTAKLQSEESDRARLAEARQAAEPTRTVIKKLSYAKAGEIVPTLQSVMSKRGAIVVDARTNTLIIREIPTYLPAVLQLIDNLDTATPQVVIESRIVETTKSLGRSLGINWSVRGKADVDSGNTTNLIFPSKILGGIDVGLGNGPTVASLVLGNILNTFNLDVALTAAENQGLLKIISSPKVTSLTNTPALIQSGVQIPVQTTVNNTTTVIYVDATLKLDVTPQITAEGTILLTVNVTKREPAVALNLALGQNVPLTIREYRGQVLVKDGGTTVIGGIFQINDQDQNNMIPGLWKIPVLGNLFRNKTRTEKHDELLIFITPRILRS